MPLSRIRPLGLKLAFADRSYKLGEAIHATVELTPRSDVEIREARVDLVCEEQYLESYTVNVPSGQPSDAGSPFNIGGTYVPPRIPKQVTKDVRQTYVHSSVVFLAGTTLPQGSPITYEARLDIETEPPAHAGVARLRWRLECVADVAMARDVKTRHKVQVTVD